NFIKSLKNQYVDTTHLILYLPLLCEDWINGLFEVLDNHKMSCTLIMGRISKHLSTVGEDKTKHVSYNWLSKALFVKSLEENNGRLIKWDRFSTLYSEKRISISLSEKLIRNENQVMDVLKTIIDERIGYCPLQIRYIEKYYDKTLIQS
ncbi:MAG: hypothetical protein OEV44_14615, partial [Spirochaetota bacterium]|nr:hypothetical protein [Spirochaetota bacterium]